MIKMKTQFGTSFGADFEYSTWKFKMPKNFEIRAGEFAIVDKQVYDKMIELLRDSNYTLKKTKITYGKGFLYPGEWDEILKKFNEIKEYI